LKPLILSLVNIAFAASAGTATAQTDIGAAPANPSVAGVAASPASYDQQYQAARALANSGQREEAIQAYSDLLVRSPGNADVLLGRGQVYARMGRWPEAEADLLAVTAASPGYADAWSALGDMYMWSDRPRLAIDAFGRWVELRPTDPAPHIARGRAYRAAGEYESARVDFDAALALGADAGQIESYLLSLMPRVHKPEAAVPAGFLWSATLGASWTGFSQSRQDWSDDILSVRRHFERGSLALESVDTRRFGGSDHAWALDGYLDLWSRAYVNLRYQQAPDATLYPIRSYYGELFQGVGRGWELSGSYGHLDFSRSNVDLYGIGVGKYVGNYYIRLRHLYVPGNGSDSNSDRLLVRYYYAGDGDNYVEVNAGAGSSSSDIPGNPGASTQTNTTAVSVAFVKFPTPRWGFKIGADYGHESNSFNSRGISGKLYLRW
jgi:YaiO family outer membrane protein